MMGIFIYLSGYTYQPDATSSKSWEVRKADKWNRARIRSQPPTPVRDMPSRPPVCESLKNEVVRILLTKFLHLGFGQRNDGLSRWN